MTTHPTPTATRIALEDILSVSLATARQDFETGGRRAPGLTNTELLAALDAAALRLGGWLPAAHTTGELEARSRTAYDDVRRGSILAAPDDAIWLVRETVRILVGDTGHYPTSCAFIAAALATAYEDVSRANGYFYGPLLPDNWGDLTGPHSWVLARDGTIIDASAAQFGYHTPAILRITATDPRAAWYRRHTGDEFDGG